MNVFKTILDTIPLMEKITNIAELQTHILKDTGKEVTRICNSDYAFWLNLFIFVPLVIVV